MPPTCAFAQRTVHLVISTNIDPLSDVPWHAAIAAALRTIVPLPPTSAFAQRTIHIIESRHVHIVREAPLHLSVTMANWAVFFFMLAYSLAERAPDQRVRLQVDAVSPCGIDLQLSAAHWTN